VTNVFPKRSDSNLNKSTSKATSGPTKSNEPATDFVGKRIAIIAPHNDDEVVGCWHFMEAMAGIADIGVIVVTRHAGDADLTDTRRTETQQALLSVGVTELSYWDIADGGAVDAADQLESLVSDLENRWDYIFCPAPNDRTFDHVPIAKAATASISSGKLVWYRSTWWTFRMRDADVIFTGSIRNKIRALSVFRSQKKIALARGVWLSVFEHLLVKRRLSSAEGFVYARDSVLPADPLNSISLRHYPRFPFWI